jgi:dimethylglycine catabolism A
MTTQSLPSSTLNALYEPASIGRLRLKNRFIQSPMHTMFSTNDGEVSPKLIHYLARRARGGVAMIILENTAVDWEVGRAAGCPVRIDKDVYISGLFDLTEAVHREGSLISAQLHHAGRQNSRANSEDGGVPVAPSPVLSTAIGEVPRELTQEEIPGIVQQFADGARRAVAAGFDMVEIHGSHGYLLTQFLSPQSNLRTDAYGGSFDNRARFPLEVVQAVRDAVGPDFPVSFRISLEERTEGGMSAEEGVAFCRLIEPYVDVFNVTAGTYESMDSIFMMQGVEPAQLLPLAARVKAVVDKPVIGISRLGWALEESASAVEGGELDFVAMARTQLTDPDLVIKVRDGEDERVRRCIACNECVGGFLFLGRRVHCVINPELGYEAEAEAMLVPQRAAKNVLVVGGGPAGVEAARAAALRGHRVTLVEGRDRLGGQVLAATAVGYKRREMEAYVRYFERELEHVGVEVLLNITVEEGDPMLGEADVVLLATGAQRPAKDDDAVDAMDVLWGGVLRAGQSVTVRGANELALNVAAFAAETGCTVTIVTGGDALGYDMNPILAAHTVGILERAGVTVREEMADGDIVVDAADSVGGGEPWDLPATDVRCVGTMVSGGRLYEATQSGFWTGARI